MSIADWLENRKKVALNKPLDINNWGIDGNPRRLSMFLDGENNLMATPVVIIDPSGSTTARAQRGVFYDRNPISINNRVDVTVTQHDAQTQQGNVYTVPSGRRCMITSCYGLIIRNGLIGNDAGFTSNTKGFISIHSIALNTYGRPLEIDLTKSGPVLANMTCMQLGDQVFDGFSGQILMVAGDDIRFWTDASIEHAGPGNVGTCEVILSYTGTEYDA